jgi:hypothetical protein
MRRHLLATALLGAVIYGCRGCDHGEQPRASETVSSEPPLPLPKSPPAAASEQYPVRWWDGLQLSSLNDAAALYASGDAQDFGELKLDGERARPTNCERWAELHAKGMSL